MEVRVAELHAVRDHLVRSHEAWIGEARSYAEQLAALEQRIDRTGELVTQFEKAGTEYSGRISKDLQSGVANQKQVLADFREERRNIRLWIVPALAAVLIVVMLLSLYAGVVTQSRFALIEPAAAMTGGTDPGAWEGYTTQLLRCLDDAAQSQQPITCSIRVEPR